MAFSPDGKVLAVTTRDGLSVMLWDIKQSVTLTTFKAHDKTIHVLAFHPNGRTLATGSEDWSVRLWNVATGRLLLTLRRDLGEARRLAFSPDGARLSVLGTSIDGRTRITSWNLTPIGD